MGARRSKYATLGPRARDLYALGMTLEEIGAQLGVSITSLSNWKKKDSGGAGDWDQARSRHNRKSPLALLHMMEQKQERLIIQMGADDDPGLVDAAAKLEKMIVRRRREVGDYSVTLGSVEILAAWSAEHCTDEEMAVLRPIIERFLGDLRRGIV